MTQEEQAQAILAEWLQQATTTTPRFLWGKIEVRAQSSDCGLWLTFIDCDNEVEVKVDIQVGYIA